eukprot:gene2747-3381_t
MSTAGDTAASARSRCVPVCNILPDVRLDTPGPVPSLREEAEARAAHIAHKRAEAAEVQSSSRAVHARSEELRAELSNYEKLQQQPLASQLMLLLKNSMTPVGAGDGKVQSELSASVVCLLRVVLELSSQAISSSLSTPALILQGASSTPGSSLAVPKAAGGGARSAHSRHYHQY